MPPTPTRRCASRLAAAVLIAVLAAGCEEAARPRAAPPPKPGVLRVRLPYELRTLDPALVTSQAETGVLRQLREPLLRPGVSLGQAQPATAESWSVSPDRLIYTFTIRSAARYSDGQPVRAQDFVYAWRRIIDPRTASPVADLFAAVVRGGDAAQALDPVIDAPRLDAAVKTLGLAAPDDRTFAVTLPNPAAQMPWVASMPQGAPLRQDLVEKAADWWAHAAEAAGNGPFHLARADPPRQVQLEPSAGYWAGRPAAAGLDFQVVTEEADALARYDSAALDIVELGTADPGRRGRRVTQAELTGFWLDLNTSRAPFDNVTVRQAFAAAVDRRGLIEGPLAGRGQVLGDLLPAGLEGHVPDAAAEQGYDAARGRSLLQTAGVDPARLGQLILLVGPDPTDRALAAGLAQQLAQNLGVSVRVDAVDAPTAFQRRLAGDWQLTGPVGWTADYPDPQQWFDLFRGTEGHNLSHWREPRYDLLVAEADAETDPSRRQDLYRQAHLILLAQAPAVFLYQRERWSLVRPSIRGLVTSPTDEWAGAVNAAAIRPA